MKILPTLLPFLLALTLSWAQNPQALQQQADSLYEARSFEKALPAYADFLAQDSSSAEAYHRYGTCYLQLGQPLLAEKQLIKALGLNSAYAKSYYNLGLIRVKKEQYEEGLRFFKAFYQLEPQDPEGVYNIAFAYASLMQADSFDVYFQLGLALDQDMLYPYENGPDTYLFFGETAKAEALIEKGIARFPDQASMYEKAIFIYTQQDKMTQVLETYQRAKAQFPEELKWYHGVAISRVQANTAPEACITSANEAKRFRFISVPYLDQMSSSLRDKKGLYFYPDLKKKWIKNPQKLALDEYFMLYYGHSQEAAFDPAGASEAVSFAQFQDFFEGGLYEEALLALEEAMESAPFESSLHYWKASCLANMKAYDRFEMAIQHYYGLALGILHTGDGTSFETAYIVTYHSDKNTIMSLLGLEPSDIMEVEHEGQAFEILIDQEEEAERKVCFRVVK